MLHEASEVQFRPWQPFAAHGPPNGSGGIYCPAINQLTEEDLATEAVQVMQGQLPLRRRKLCRSADTGTFQSESFFKVCDFPPVEMRL